MSRFTFKNHSWTSLFLGQTFVSCLSIDRYYRSKNVTFSRKGQQKMTEKMTDCSNQRSQWAPPPSSSPRPTLLGRKVSKSLFSQQFVFFVFFWDFGFLSLTNCQRGVNFGCTCHSGWVASLQICLILMSLLFKTFVNLVLI